MEPKYWFWSPDYLEWYESSGYGVGVELDYSGRVKYVVVFGTPDDRDGKRDRLVEAAEFAVGIILN